MKESLHIEDKSCIRCGRCVRVCPSEVFAQESSGGPIQIQNSAHCIICGHCVAVCPTASVHHPDFPEGTVHSIDYKVLPSPEAFLLLCKARRSNRAFSTKPIPETFLEKILEAAHRAPTASNKQEVRFTLVTDSQKLKEISDITVDTFTSVLKKLENPFLKPLIKIWLPEAFQYIPTFRRLAAARERGKDLILRGATALLLIHTPVHNRFGAADANLAYQNGSLMAETLGVSQFYTGFICSALQQDKHHRLEKLLGIDEQIHAGMALGMPALRYPHYIDKLPLQVKRF